jgi:glycosyltransferase involved in cell wall biosynthesis
MACERPIISTELPGVKAVAGDKVMYAANEGDYKEKIGDLYKDEKLRREMGKNGRVFVAENYDWEKIVRRLECLLEAVNS